MLLVIGGTGNVGRPLVAALRAAGAPFRALARGPARAHELLEAGADTVIGDLGDPSSLDRAMAGVDRLFLLSSPSEQQRELQANAIDAARRAGVRHVVKLSVVGADPAHPNPILRWHGETEAYLRDSGMAWTMLRPHIFMLHTRFFAREIATDGRFHAPSVGRVPIVHPRDVAAVAARALTTDGHEGRAYVIGGPQLLSWSDMAGSIGRAVGRPVTWLEAPPADACAGLRALGLPPWIADAIVDLWVGFARGEPTDASDPMPDVGGEPTTFDRFAAEMAPAFQPAPGGVGAAHQA